jgi:hypothetical protein
VKSNIGYNNIPSVSLDIKKVLSKFQYETPEDILVLDLARIDEMQKLATMELRRGNVSMIPTNVMLMKFRRETLGMTSETIQERAREARSSSVTNGIHNSGIMVIQGTTTGDYVRAMAQAAGIPESEVQRELESVSESNKSDSKKSQIVSDLKENDPTFAVNSANSKKVVDSEIIDAEIIPEPGTRVHDQKKSKKVRYVLVETSKPQRADLSHDHDAGGTRRPSRPANGSETSQKSGKRHPGSIREAGSFERLTDRVIERSERDQRRFDEETSVRLSENDFSEPLLDIDVPDDERTYVFPVREFPIKDYDANVDLTSGVSYRQPPRKLTHEESQKVVRKKLRNNDSGNRDVIRIVKVQREI